MHQPTTTEMSSSPGRQKVPRAGASYGRLKGVPEGPSSLEEDLHLSLWDSLESDTESLAQERRYQLELQKRIHESKELLLNPAEEEEEREEGEQMQGGFSRHDSGEDEEEEEEEESYVFDSLDGVAFRPEQRQPASDDTQPRDGALQEGTERTSQAHWEDEYAELRYDPNWRNNLQGAGVFREDQDQPAASPEETRALGEPREVAGLEVSGVRARGQHSSPCVRFNVSGTDRQTDTLTRPPLTPHHPGRGKPREALQQEGPVRSRAGRAPRKQEPEPPWDDPVELFSDNREERFDQLYHNYSRQQQRTLQPEPGWGGSHQPCANKQHNKRESHAHRSRANPPGPRQDFVERNKQTLGVSAPKPGSYLHTHGTRREQSHITQVIEAAQESSSSQEGEESNSDPEYRWQRRTQKLKGFRGKASERRGLRATFSEKKPSCMPGTRNPWGDGAPWGSEQTQALNSPRGIHAAQRRERTVSVGRAQVLVIEEVDGHGAGAAQDLGNSRSSGVSAAPWPSDTAMDRRAPALHLNINLNTSADLVPYIPHRPRGPTLPPPYPAGNWAADRAMEDHRARFTLPQWQDHTLSLGSQEPDDQAHTYSLGSQGSRSYAVLPPIGHTAGSDSQLSGRARGHLRGDMQRSSSEGYLAQLEKQKQLKERANYKAYTLEDYRNFKQDVKLGGLGPNHQVSEETAEKMRRQRQYSELVRQQNRTLNRNPLQPSSVPAGKESRPCAPRRKALEYAKNIPKPRPPPQPKANEKAGRMGYTEHTQYLEDLDLSQLATLEILQKRHEEEKQIVANLKALHAI
ncbi:jhy protein homolog [Amia ocellicauda]|uniref:jhy protein homolog n=1 Tax=Amia ocellicauda TaxID=2972642 RepID=UPI00346443D9